MSVSRKKVHTVLFCLAYFTILMFSMMGHIPGLRIWLNRLAYIANAILLAIGITQNRFLSKKLCIGLIIAFLYSILLLNRTGFSGLFKLLLLIIASRNVNFKTLLKFDFVSRIILIGAVFILCFLGVAPNVVADYPDGTVRYSWGFQNTNHLALAIFIGCLELLYLWRMQVNGKRIFFILALMIFSDIASGSRTANLIGAMTLLCSILYTISPSIWTNRVIYFLVKFAVWFLAGLTAILTIQFENGENWALKVDSLLSGRLKNIQFFHQKFGVTLWGNDLSTGGRTLDSIYGFLLLGLGVVGFLVFCIAITKLITVIYKKGDPSFGIVLLCLLIYGLSERLWMAVDYNILMIAFRELFYHDVFDIYKRGKPLNYQDRVISELNM